MRERCPLKSKLQTQAQHEQIPELSLEDLARVLKANFGIATEPDERPYWVRFVGTPYNPFVHGCRSTKVMAHNRGTHVSPLGIKQVLQKFEIPESDFLEALGAFQQTGSLPPQDPFESRIVN